MATPAPAAPAAPQAAQAQPNPIKGLKPEAVTAPTPETEPEFEVKVGGEVRKYKKSEAEKLLSKAGYADQSIRAANERLKELKAAEAKRQAELEAGKKDPRALLKAYGVDHRDFARAILEEEIAAGRMSPEQREKQQLEAQLAEMRAQLEEKTAKEQEASNLKAQKEIQEQMEADLYGAAQRAGMLDENGKADPDAFYAVYQAAQEALDLGLIERGLWNADHVVEVAQANLDRTFRRLEASALKNLKGKALYDRLGEKVANELLRYKAELLRGGANRDPQAPAAAAPKSNANSKQLTPKQLDEEIKQMTRGLK